MIRNNVIVLSAYLAMSLLIGGNALGATIYRSESADGTVRFATEPLDASYVLFLNDDPSLSAKHVPRPTYRAAQGGVRFASLIDHHARKHGIDPLLVQAVIHVESGFNPSARSPKGAIGLMQLMPMTAKRYNVENSYDVSQNIEGGVRYLSYLIGIYQGNVELALAAYNAGEGAVAKFGKKIPPYTETLRYVPAVLAVFNQLKYATGHQINRINVRH